MFSLIPWRDKKACNPAHAASPFHLVQDEFQSIFDRFFGRFPEEWGSDWNVPRTWGLNLEEKEHEVIVRAELPGFEVDEIEVELKENMLTIEAKHEVKDVENGEAQHFNHVRRALMLPAGLDVDKIDAQYRNGVLEVHIPRTPEAQGRRIAIKGEPTQPTQN